MQTISSWKFNLISMQQVIYGTLMPISGVWAPFEDP